MDTDDVVRGHYRRGGLDEIVLAALEGAGIDIDRLQPEDLADLDQLHVGFARGSEYLLDHLELRQGMALVDVGSGIGGPARMAAARHGCRVTGIDLSPEFVALARTLTERMGLAPQMTFDEGSATEMPYGDGSFARAMLNHVGMNISDKAAVFAEVRRVIEPGGLFAVYEQMRLGAGDLTYPLPWANDETSSFVETRQRYVDLLVDGGFRVEHDEDRTAANAAAGPLAPGTLTPAVLFGPEFGERVSNNVTAAMSGTLGAVLMVARAV